MEMSKGQAGVFVVFFVLAFVGGFFLGARYEGKKERAPIIIEKAAISEVH
jgi:hypothetical protein